MNDSNLSSRHMRQGLRLEYAMGAALSATNVSDVQITNCTISNSGTDGIIIDGRESTVSVSLRLTQPFQLLRVGGA